MKILLTGATGFVGQPLLTALRSMHQVIVLGRTKPTLCDVNFIECDLTSIKNRNIDMTSIDVVVHNAARVHVMDDLTRNPLQEFRKLNTYASLELAKMAVEQGVKRFVFISSVKVNGESTSPCNPFTPLDEYNPQDPYGQSKAEAEEQLIQLAKATGLEVVIIRPPLVYGPGVKANFASLFKLVSRGFPLPFAAIRNNKRSLVSVTNLVDLIVTCVAHPNAVNQVFMVSDDYDLSTREIIEKMSEALGVRAFQLPIPSSLYRIAGKVLGKSAIVERLIGSLQVDISHTKIMLDWRPPQRLEEGFYQTAKAYKTLDT